MRKVKPQSEIVPMDDPVGTGHTCAMEFVPSLRRPIEIYIVFDGQRIAARGIFPATRQPGWLPLIAGYRVIDEGPDQIGIFFGDERVH